MNFPGPRLWLTFVVHISTQITQYPIMHLIVSGNIKDVRKTVYASIDWFVSRAFRIGTKISINGKGNVFK